MVRTKGAVDRRPRRLRSDIGKKRKKYAGKKIFSKRKKKFIKREGTKDQLKLRIMEKKKMSANGWRNWNKKIRPKIHPFVYMWLMRVDVLVADISNRKDIEEWAIDVIGYPGKFLVFGFSGTSKNRFGVKPVRMFDVDITETGSGLNAKMTSKRLHRYKWFWTGD